MNGKFPKVESILTVYFGACFFIALISKTPLNVGSLLMGLVVIGVILALFNFIVAIITGIVTYKLNFPLQFRMIDSKLIHLIPLYIILEWTVMNLFYIDEASGGSHYLLEKEGFACVFLIVILFINYLILISKYAYSGMAYEKHGKRRKLLGSFMNDESKLKFWLVYAGMPENAAKDLVETKNDFARF